MNFAGRVLELHMLERMNTRRRMKLEHTKLEPVPQLVLSCTHLVSPVTSNNCEDVPLHIQFVPLLLTFLQTRKNILQLSTIRAYTVYHIRVTLVSYTYIAYIS